MEALLVVNEAEKNAVKADFVNKINPWCELTSIQQNIPPEQMCQVAVQVFGDSLSSTWIHRCIDEKFKIGYKVHSAKQKKSSPSQKKAKLIKFAQKLGFNIVNAVQETSSPLFETIIFQTQEDNKNGT